MNRLPEANPATEAPRAVALAMTDLASSLGDLETAARALAGRIHVLIPGGNPFNREAGKGAIGGPVPVRSHHCDELHNRIYQVKEITDALNEMAQGIEI